MSISGRLFGIVRVPADRVPVDGLLFSDIAAIRAAWIFRVGDSPSVHAMASGTRARP
jgi:hypothetical protein